MQLEKLNKTHCSSNISQVGQQKQPDCHCKILWTSGASCFGFYQDSIISLPSSMFGMFVLERFLHLVAILKMQPLLGKTPSLIRWAGSYLMAGTDNRPSHNIIRPSAISLLWYFQQSSKYPPPHICYLLPFMKGKRKLSGSVIAQSTDDKNSLKLSAFLIHLNVSIFLKVLLLWK